MESTLLLYLFDLETVSEDDVASLKALLNTEQQQKCDSINQRKKTEFILSRSLLTFAVNSALESEDIALNIQERLHLPPLVTIAAQHNIQFSISHSKHMLGITVRKGKEAIGFDIQAMKDFSKDINFPQNSLESAQYFCNEAQINELTRYIDDRALFTQHYTQIWANKEAYLKSLQLGINHELLKKTGFIKEKKQSCHLHTSFFFDSGKGAFALAIYCKKPYSVTSQTLIINQLKFSAQKPNLPLEWEALDVIN